jgi:formiminotetrahydrofolate cyclodeaminase
MELRFRKKAVDKALKIQIKVPFSRCKVLFKVFSSIYKDAKEVFTYNGSVFSADSHSLIFKFIIVRLMK